MLVNHRDTEGTEKRGEGEGYSTIRTIPSFRTGVLKFSKRPTFFPLNRRYVNNWAR